MQLLPLKTLFFLTAIFSSSIVDAQYTYSLEGKIDNMEGKKIFLSLHYGKQRLRDSAIVQSGKFIFSGSIPGPIMSSLFFKDRFTNQRQETSVFLEPGHLQLSVNADNIQDRTVIGSTSHLARQELENIWYQEYGRHERELQAAREQLKKDTNNVVSRQRVSFLDSVTDAGAHRLPMLTKAFILGHANSPVAAHEIFFDLSFWPIDSISKYYHVLSPDIQNGFYGQMIKEFLAKAVVEGQQAADFSVKDVNNTSIRLSDYRYKKYVLLDFWASWCKPCVEEFPDLKKLYDDHKNELEIISVSTDQDVLAWKQSLKQHKLPWRQVRIGGEPEDENASKKYIGTLFGGIPTIPRQFLIDKNGVIVGIFISSPLDMQKLNALLQQ